MARQIIFKGVVLTLPSTASFTDSERLATAGLAGTGVVAIVGEAEGGAGYDSDVVHLITKANADAAKELFISGPLADAIGPAFAPANDAAVPGGANTLLAVNVRRQTQSILTFGVGAQDLITLTSTIFGTPANLLSLTIATSASGRIFTLQNGTEDPLVSGVLAVQDGTDTDVAFKITYTGDATTAVMVITDTTLAVTLAGDQTDGSVDQTLSFVTFNTLQKLVDFIETQTGYTATAIRTDADVFLPENLDHVGNVSPVDITSEVKLYSSTFDILQFFTNNTDLVDPTLAATATEDEGQPDNLAKTFFAGGSAGPTVLNSDWQSSFDLLKKQVCEAVVPLISADVGSQIVATINSQADQHAADTSNPGGNKEREAWASITGTKAVVKAEAQRLNSFHTVVAAQKLELLNVDGNLVEFDEWGFALVGACARAGIGEEGEPITHKFLRASGITQDSSWNPEEDGEELLLAGLLLAQNIPGSGIRVIKGVTTFTKKENLALSDENQVWEWKTIQRRVRERIESRFIGKKAAVITITAIKQEVIAVLDEQRTAGIIVDSVVNGETIRGFTDPDITFDGTVVGIKYGVSVTPGINFITTIQFLEPVSITV